MLFQIKPRKSQISLLGLAIPTRWSWSADLSPTSFQFQMAYCPMALSLTSTQVISAGLYLPIRLTNLTVLKSL